jgi:hypothetical protein
MFGVGSGREADGTDDVHGGLEMGLLVLLSYIHGDARINSYFTCSITTNVLYCAIL